MTNVTTILGNEAGIQYQGVTDASSSTGTYPVIGLIVGNFIGGRTDKPMTITNANIKTVLGYDPLNPHYIAVQDVLNSGVPSVQVLRVVADGDDGETGGGGGGQQPQTTPFKALLYIDEQGAEIQAFEPFLASSPTLGSIPVTLISEGSMRIYVANIPPATEGEYIFEFTAPNPNDPLPSIMLGGCVLEILQWSSTGHKCTDYSSQKIQELGDFGYKIRAVPNTLHPSITNLTQWFKQAEVFNDPNISEWDVTHVTSMYQIFAFTKVFNQDLSEWDVRNMPEDGFMGLFYGSESFTNNSLKQWCVPQLSSTPDDFNNNGSTLPNANLPVWGTCPSGGSVTPEPEPEPETRTGGLKVIINVNSEPVITALEPFTLTSPTLGNIAVTSEKEGNMTMYVALIESNSVNEHMVEFNAVNPSDPLPSIALDGCALEILQWSTSGHKRSKYSTEWLPEVSGLGSYIRAVPKYLDPSITDISQMFKQAEIFNDSNIRTWDMSNVRQMYQAFAFTEAFNQDLSAWNVRNMTSSGMEGMFYGSLGFINNSLKQWCVPSISSKPSDFNGNGSTLPDANLPVWGTCPNG